jgi:hypothetical protein
MLRFGTDCYPPNRWGNDVEEEEFRRLLRESMHDLNRRAFSADCKTRYKTLDQQPEDYFSFDPDDRQSVYRNAPAVCKCLSDMRTKLGVPSPRSRRCRKPSADARTSSSSSTLKPGHAGALLEPYCYCYCCGTYAIKKRL